nr:hypothetical protein [Bacillus licheniformis]
MTVVGFCVLLCSAFIHASWNYLSKKADGGVPFIWLFTAIATVIYTPLAIGVVIYEKPEIGIWRLVIIMASILAHLGFFLVLQKGYKKGDLSLVYPIARGTGPAAHLHAGGRLFWRDVDAARYYRDSIDCDQHSFFYRGSEAVKRIRLVHTGSLRAGGRRHYCRIYSP